MNLAQVHLELLAGKTLQLSFTGLLELRAFKNALAVYIHRQNQKLILLGMDDDSTNKKLRIRIDDCTATVSFEEKVMREYEFKILSMLDKGNGEQGKG